MQLPGRFLTVDWLIVLPTLYLVAIGLVVLRSLEQAGNSLVDLSTQLLAIAIGFILLLVLQRVSKETLTKTAPIVYALALAGLVAVLVAGTSAQGAERWLQVGSFQFQPSELAKVGLILIIARLLATRKDAINSPVSFLVILTYAVLPATLVVLQPDLGTAITIFLLWLAMIGVSRLKQRRLVFIVVSLIIVAATSWPLLAGYQQDRITGFLRPNDDPLGTNYNVLQSTIAVGSGGLFGKGLDAGSQSQYNFLPSAQTDFVFAVTAEKLGVVGALSVIVAFLLLVVRAIMVAWTAKSEFGRYVATGVAVLLLLQSVVNIGMNIGLLPVTGLPLPLMSFGGTHIVVELALIGLLLGVARRNA